MVFTLTAPAETPACRHDCECDDYDTFRICDHTVADAARCGCEDHTIAVPNGTGLRILTALGLPAQYAGTVDGPDLAQRLARAACDDLDPTYLDRLAVLAAEATRRARAITWA